MTEYRLKPGRLGKTLIEGYKSIEDKFVDTFLEEDGSLKTGGMAEKATETYQKIEDAVVGGYQKIEDAFVDAFLEKVDDSEDGGVQDEDLGGVDELADTTKPDRKTPSESAGLHEEQD